MDKAVFILYAPYTAILLLVIGAFLLLSSQAQALSRPQLKRLQRMYALIEEETKTPSLWDKYESWLKRFLVESGYVDKLGSFYSIVRLTIVFFFLTTFLLLFLSGITPELSFLISFAIAVLSLSFPHLVLYYLRKRQFSVIATEYLTVTNYILDALDGAQKDIFDGLKEARTLVSVLNDPLENFLNRYRTKGLGPACDALMLEVPAPETEQFLAAIGNGFEYRDRINLMDYINAFNTMKHTLTIDAKERQAKQRETLYSLLVMIPALLTITITLLTSYANVTSALSHTVF